MFLTLSYMNSDFHNKQMDMSEFVIVFGLHWTLCTNDFPGFSTDKENSKPECSLLYGISGVLPHVAGWKYPSGLSRSHIHTDVSRVP